jgi:trans-2-enoyl-CoA reductase
MSLHPVRVPNGLLIFKNLSFRGFWITQWYEEASIAEKQEMFRHLFSFAESGLLHTKVEKFHALSEAKEAIARAQQGGRDGKIVFRIR